MFIVRWIRKLVSLPFLWLGQLAGMIKLPVSLTLMKAAFAVSGDGDIGRLALVAVYRQMGPDAALAQAAGWMAGRAHAQIAAWAGLMAVDAGRSDEARSYLARAQQLGSDRLGMIEMLEFRIAQCDPDPAAACGVVDRLAGRRDLAPSLTRSVLNVRMWNAMLAGRLDEAQACAQHLLEVDDEPAASMVMWALSRRRGNQRRAAGHLRGAAGAPADLRLQWQCMALAAVGSGDEAAAALAELRQLDPGTAERLEEHLRKGQTA